MMSSVLLQKLLQLKSLPNLCQGLNKQCLVSLSTQSFYNNMNNAVLLKESDYSVYDTNYDYTATHHTIMELLDCSPGDAIHLIENDPELLRLSADNLIQIRKLCRGHGVPLDIVRKNLSWISRTEPVSLDHRFLHYRKWSFLHEEDRPQILRLLSLSLTKLTSLTCRAINEKNKIPQGNRISYYSENLRTSVSDSTDLIIKYPFMMTRHLDIVFGVTGSLLDAGVNPQDMCRDPWLLMQSPLYVQRRLKILQDKGIQNIKPWMVRATEKDLARCIEIRELAQEVSREFDTKEKYLCERLEIEPREFLEWKRKYPRVAQISLCKLKTMLDLLMSAGFQPKDIFKHAEVLTFSPETMERRIRECVSRPLGLYNLTILSLKNKKFESYLKQVDQKPVFAGRKIESKCL